MVPIQIKRIKIRKGSYKYIHKENRTLRNVLISIKAFMQKIKDSPSLLNEKNYLKFLNFTILIKIITIPYTTVTLN